MSEDNAFQALLKSCLATHDITVTELAAALGVSRQTIYAWKNGVNTPTPQAATEFCDLFDIKDRGQVLSALTHNVGGRPYLTEKQRFERERIKLKRRTGLDLGDRDQLRENMSQKFRPFFNELQDDW